MNNMNLIADKMLETLPGHWVPYSSNIEKTGSGCFLNWMGYAGQSLDIHWKESDIFGVFAAKVAEDLFPGRGVDDPNDKNEEYYLHLFNDHPDTTEEDVVAVLVETRKRLDTASEGV